MNVMHHEQVHAQQWALHGLDFESLYANDFITANYDAWIAYQHNPFLPQGYSTYWGCNMHYEQQANLVDGGYTQSWGCVQTQSHGNL
jgi:hypothetical protein